MPGATRRGVQAAQLSFDAVGAAYSERFGDVYASRDGALGHARHVFLGGNDLPERWRARDQFVILEAGFGLGTNFMATWQAWRADRERPRRLHFVSIERHPLSAEDLLRGACAELGDLATELAAVWPLALPGIHRREFDDGQVVLTLAFGDARMLAPELVLGADAIFLDGFAPDRNGEMWDPALLKALARCARLRATLATWSSARPVREALAACGFEIDVRAGFGSKREMLAANYAPRWTVRRYEPPAARSGDRTALVVGAGLAGAACAEALARRGWQVTVLDQAFAPATGSSSLPWGVMHPHFSIDDNVLSRLTRAGVAATRAALERVAPGGTHRGVDVWRTTGVFENAPDQPHSSNWRSALEELGFPHEWMTTCDVDVAETKLGLKAREAGVWWSEAALISPPAFIAALLARSGIRFIGGCAVAHLVRRAGQWIACDALGNPLAEAAVAIVANALDAPRLLTLNCARLQAVRGRISFLDGEPFTELRSPVSGGGTLLRAPDGKVAVGATYEVPSHGVDPLTDDDAMASNLARLGRLLANPPEVRIIGSFDGVRAVSHDRLPLAGAIPDEVAGAQAKDGLSGAHLRDLPRQADLYGCFALGSRGLSLASLLAEKIACQIEGEPLPLERTLADAVDPARFLLRALRTGRLAASEACQASVTTPP
ncbi:MAG: bifunctional tRNA (5-methylaminomethyl-2-thiouridine)(34)-methyltransferase MnmD/FAD-dependent 5-carboxymethylaminomethyl-2-thiouridine(34) oxidoreductase MnmC [Burkholderiaceae bacterium]